MIAAVKKKRRLRHPRSRKRSRNQRDPNLRTLPCSRSRRQTMTQNTTATTPARRVFNYGEHRFDDPGPSYTVEQIRQHLVQYFPELAHAATEEKTLPDGTVEISFRKQVARKGAGDEEASIDNG